MAKRGAGIFLGFAVLGGLATDGPAAAQVELPEILVTTPSPIQGSEPADTGGFPPGALIVVPGAFVPVTVIPGYDIEASAAANLGDLLFARPGISASTFAPGAASRPVIRGLDNYRVRIQENGIGTHDLSTFGDDHAVPLDPLAIEQVEVIRGPATLRWGSQAIGGVVSAINNRIPSFRAPPGIRGTLKGALSSVDRDREAAASIDAAHGNLALHVDGFFRQADDYRTPDGRQENTFARSRGGSIGGSVFFDGGFVGLSVSHMASRYGVPRRAGNHHVHDDHAHDDDHHDVHDDDHDHAHGGGLSYIDLRQTKFQLKGEFTGSGPLVDKVRFWAGATRYFHKEMEVEDGAHELHATFRNREQEARIEVQRLPFTSAWGEHSGAFGIHYGHQRVRAGAEAAELLAPARSRRLAAYAFEELKLAAGRRVQAAGRIEHVKVEGTGATFPGDPESGFVFDPDNPVDPQESRASRSFTPKSASIGFLQDLPGGLVASLTLQHVERAPEITELFSKGSHHASRTFEIGNPNLKLEKAQSVEIGLKKAAGRLRFDATAYYTRYRNFIYRHLTGIECGHEFDECLDPSDPDHEDEFEQVFYSQRGARFYGAEIAAQLDVAELGGGIFGIDGRYDFVNAKFDDGTYVPRIPPHRLGGGLFWRNEHWFARVSLLHAFAQNRLSEHETRTAGYNLLRAELSYRRALADGRSFTLGVTGDNLLNERIRNHVSFNKDDVLLPGRNIRGFVKVTF